MIAWLHEWIVLALKIVGGLATVLAVVFFIAASVLIVWINREPPEDWS